jgi:hypothetical protein
MRTVVWLVLIWLCSSLATAKAAGTVMEYPSALLDTSGKNEGCWMGVGFAGEYIVRVVPEKWLVGTPTSTYGAVTLGTDEWVDLAFSGRIVSVDGNDVKLVEWGRAGEQALVFVTDGSDQEYLLGVAKALSTGGQSASYIDLRMTTIPMPFEPRAIRVVAIDDKGDSPGFDLGSVRAYVSHVCQTGPSNPNPVNGSAGIQPAVKLNWTPTCQAKQHIVYLGTSESQVIAGDPLVRQGIQARDANTYDPNSLAMGKTYYWRVDEVMADNSVVAGPVWRFTVADSILVDDFESYGSLGGDIFSDWEIRDVQPHGSNRASRYLASDSISHGCQLSMVFSYYYDNYYVSEVYYPLPKPQNWLREDVRVVQVWMYGTAGNPTAGQMYAVAVDSKGKEARVPFVIADGNALARPEWTVCRASVAGLSQVDANAICGLGIGLRLPEGAPSRQYAGWIHLDDLTLHPAICLDNMRPLADTNGDCVVDRKDLSRLASQWLADRTTAYTVAEPNAPILWYRFDGTTDDSAGNAPGQIAGRPYFVTGKHGQAVAFKNAGDVVTVPSAVVQNVFSRTRQAITISFWQISDESVHLNDTLCGSNYQYGVSDPSISINLGCWRSPGQYRWDCGTPWSFANRLAGRHRDKLEWTGRWNHWAFTKDIRAGAGASKGRMEIYLNGVLYDSRSGTTAPIDGITSFEIGQGWYGRYDGLMDDFQIYDYALSGPEIAYLASGGTGLIEATTPLSADRDFNGHVDFKDYATLASQWLNSGLWP